MKVFLIAAFAVIMILGNAMILLRTARKPGLPGAVKCQRTREGKDTGL